MTPWGHEAFLWSEQRTVTKTAPTRVSLNSNTYEVDACPGRGTASSSVFDPFDLHRHRRALPGPGPMAAAIPHRIGRHVHRIAVP